MKKFENPLFESLVEKAKNYSSKEINEQATDKLDANSASKYVRMIVGEWASSIVKFTQNCPSQELKEKIYPSTMESIQKLGNNASVDDLVESFKSIWKDIMGKVNSYNREDIKKAYEDAGKGFDKLDEAYKIYKEKAGELATNPDILKKVNEGMSEYVKNAQEAIKKAIEVIKK